MGNAGGKPADGLQFLAVSNLDLLPLPIGGIGEHYDHADRLSAVANRSRAVTDGKAAAIFPEEDFAIDLSVLTASKTRQDGTLFHRKR
jgi:hypothetical protein